ncbi:hypothetical protein PINS_up021517 [Pythium insidiosum]|nr:hypothetical protein PINS_up021517 [Pythium insidiosum]
MLDTLRWRDDVTFLDATSATRRESALLMACRKRQHGVARLLMLSGANAELADRGGTTALDVLRREKRDDLLELWAELKGRDTKEAPAPTVALALERQREGEEKKTATEETALKTEAKDSTSDACETEDSASRCGL